jgi:hypothetical protein
MGNKKLKKDFVNQVDVRKAMVVYISQESEEHRLDMVFRRNKASFFFSY